MTSLAVRSEREELMDAPDLDARTYAEVLGDLAKVNRVTLAARPTLSFLNNVRACSGTAKLRILDVGFGDGGMLRVISRWARRKAVAAELVGIDLNAKSAPAARAATSPDLAIDYRTGDYADLAGEGWDIVISSLVAHHMTRDQLIAFLRFMERESAHGWFVNDLHRHPVAAFGYPILAKLMRWHPIVRHDGALSIARSYRPAEWQPLLAEAGIADATVQRFFPYRLCVERLR